MLAATYAVKQAQTMANDDVMLICTGSTFKWISQSQFLEHGEIVFLDSTSDTPLPEQHDVDCGYQYLSLYDSYLPELPTATLHSLAYEQLKQSLGQRPYTSFPYKNRHSRAPPLAA